MNHTSWWGSTDTQQAPAESNPLVKKLHGASMAELTGVELQIKLWAKVNSFLIAQTVAAAVYIAMTVLAARELYYVRTLSLNDWTYLAIGAVAADFVAAFVLLLVVYVNFPTAHPQGYSASFVGGVLGCFLQSMIALVLLLESKRASTEEITTFNNCRYESTGSSADCSLSSFAVVAMKFFAVMIFIVANLPGRVVCLTNSLVAQIYQPRKTVLDPDTDPAVKRRE